MSRYLLSKAWRDAWLHRGRTGMALAALAVALTGAGVVLAAQQMMREATRSQFLASEPVQATLSFDAVTPALLEQIRILPEVAAVRARRTWSGSFRSEAGARRMLLFAYDRWSDEDLGAMQALAGTWPPETGSIVIESSALEFSGASVGDLLHIEANGGDVALRVSGVARDVALAPAWMEHVVYGFATLESLAVLGAPPEFDEVQFRIGNPGADQTEVRKVAAQIAALARAQGRQLRQVDIPVPGQHVHAAQMESLLLTQGAFGMAALLASAFLLYNLISALLAREARQIAVLKTLGASPRAVALLYLGFSAGLGALACVIALPAVAWAGTRYGHLKLSLLNFDTSVAPIPWSALTIVATVGLLVPVLAAALPVRRELRTSISTTLASAGLEPSSKTWRLPGRSALPVALRWALDNAFRKPRRAALTVIALALGGAVFVGAGSLRIAVVGAVDFMFRGQHHDAVIAWSTAPPVDVLRQIGAGIGGLEQSEIWWRSRASLEGVDGLIEPPFAILGIPPDSRLLDLPVSRGRSLENSDDQTLMVSRALARDHVVLQVGANVELRHEQGNLAWQVIGEFDAGPQAIAYAPATRVRAMSGSVPMLAIRSEQHDASAQIDLIQRLRDAFADAGWPVSSSQRPDANRRVIEDHLLMVVEFLGAMSGLMLLVAGLAIASIAGLGVLEREREIAILRSIGAPPRRIFMLIWCEALMLGFAGWLLAVPLAWPASALLAEAFGRVMFSLPSVGPPPLGALAQWLGVALGIATLASVVPAWRAQRRPVLATLQQP